MPNLQVSVSSEPCSPSSPSPVQTPGSTPRTAKMRLKKFLVSKVVNSRFGRSRIEHNLDEFEERLLALFVEFAEEYDGEKLSIELKKAMFQVMAKVFVFLRNSEISYTQLDQFHVLLNSLVGEITKQKYNVEALVQILESIRHDLVTMVGPLVTGRTIERIDFIFNYCNNPARLKQLSYSKKQTAKFIEIKQGLMTLLSHTQLSPTFASQWAEREQADHRSAELDTQIEMDRYREVLNFKVLLLGAGESGKSTVMSQLRRLAKEQDLPLTKELVSFYSQVLHNNTMEAMQTILKHYSKKATDGSQVCTLRNPELHEAAAYLSTLSMNHQLSPSDAEQIQMIWLDAEIQEALFHRDDFYVPDSAQYYFVHCSRFTDKGFRPTEKDVAMSRIRTTGVRTERLEFSPITYSFVDVGGQRNERRKWVGLFENVAAMFYVVNLTGYRKICFEDSQQNRLMESLELFDKTVNNPVFKSMPIFLLFNKKDLFMEQLKREGTKGKGLRRCFPEYEGGNTLDDCVHFILSEFRKRMPAGNELRGVCVITALLKEDVHRAFRLIMSHLMNEQHSEIEEACAALGVEFKMF